MSNRRKPQQIAGSFPALIAAGIVISLTWGGSSTASLQAVLTAAGAPGFTRGSISALLAREYRPRASGELKARSLTSDQIRCWVLVDLDSFFCAPCLDPLIDFCRAVPARIQEARLRGILVDGASTDEGQAQKRAPLLQKKWRGFCRAHEIRFPATVDISRAFAGRLKAGVLLMVWDAGRGWLRTYALPLKQGQLEEIVRILLS